jgi:proteasome lid subunit RPN8/RPN11
MEFFPWNPAILTTATLMARSERRSKRKHGDAAEHSADANTPHQDAVDSAASASSESTEIPADQPAVPDAPALEVRSIPGDSTLTESSEWAQKPWPATLPSRRDGYQVVIRRSVLNEISTHGQTARDVEVCGVVAGNVFRDDAGPYLSIEASIRGEHAGSSTAQVTFTAETWTQIQSVMESEHPDQRVVGWYHTHPGFGIFLSEMDLFIHGNFFNLPWQIAFVYDPISGEEGLFIWRDGKTERVPFYVDEDVEKEIAVPTVPVSPEMTAAALGDFSRRIQDIERRQQRLMLILGILLLIILGYPFVLYTILNDRERPVQHQANPQLKSEPIAATEPAAPSSTTRAIDAPASNPSPTTAPASQPIPTTIPTTFPTLPTTQPAQLIKPSDAAPSSGAKVLNGAPSPADPQRP